MNMIPEDDLPPLLRERLAGVRQAGAALSPPPAIEAALRAQLFANAPAAARPAPAAPARTPLSSRAQPPSLFERCAAWLAWPVSVAAVTALCSWMVFNHPALAPESPDAALLAAAGAGDVAPGQTATPFLALAALDDIPAGARGEIVTATLPRATLAEFGLPVSPMRAAEPINAEFLVGPNGGVYAVRFVDAGNP